MFEFFRKPAKKESIQPFEPLPAAFDESRMEAYREAAKEDGELEKLLTSRAQIIAFQNVGHGVAYDVKEREKLESAIAERYAESAAS